MHQTPEMSGLTDAEAPLRDCPHLVNGRHQDDHGAEVLHLGDHRPGPMPVPQHTIHFCYRHGLRMCGACAVGHKLTCEVEPA